MVKSCLLSVVVLALPISTMAEDRRGEAADVVDELHLKIDHAVRFDDGSTLDAGQYTIDWNNGQATFILTRTMEEVARVPVVDKPAQKEIPKPTAVLKAEHNGHFVLTLRLREQVGTISGVFSTTVHQNSLVGLNETPSSLPSQANSEARPADAVVKTAWERLRAELDHCADRANKLRWTVDEPRYEQCVCPLGATLRLPKVAAQYVLPVTRTVSAKLLVEISGRVKGCALTAPGAASVP